MNEKIADILKTAISGLNFVDKITGLIQVGYLTKGEVLKKVGKEFAYDELNTVKVPMSLGYTDCTTSKPGSYDLYFPDKAYKSVIFFEDQGVSLVDQHRARIDYVATLRLVCWFNRKKIEPDTTVLKRNDLIALLNNAILDVQANTSDFNRLYVEFKGEAVHSEDIYSKYDLDVNMYQYMMYPYELFALDYDIFYTVTKICPDDIELNPDVC